MNKLSLPRPPSARRLARVLVLRGYMCYYWWAILSLYLHMYIVGLHTQGRATIYLVLSKRYCSDDAILPLLLGQHLMEP